MIDHDDLQTALRDLTDDRPEPADPAALIRPRVRSHRRRRRTTAAVLSAAAVTAAVGVGASVDGFRSPTDAAVTGPGVAPVAPQSSGRSPGSPISQDELPSPWSERRYTDKPVSNGFPPLYYVASGKLAGGTWNALAHVGEQPGTVCLVVQPQEINDAYICTKALTPARPADWFTSKAYRGQKPQYEWLRGTLVMGSVPVSARSVRVVTAGGSYDTPAIGTPASDRVRSFALMVPEEDATVRTVTPLDASGIPVTPSR